MTASDLTAEGPPAGSSPPGRVEAIVSEAASAFEVPPVWRERVAGTLINPETLLATDYLNHFNEAAMIIGMVPDIPEMFADLEAWRPRSYAEHFRGAGLDYGSLAAEAYEWAPPGVKGPFETVLGQIERTILIATRRLAASIAAGDPEATRGIAATSAATLTALIGTAGGIIAGGRSTLSQEDVDRLESGGGKEIADE